MDQPKISGKARRGIGYEKQILQRIANFVDVHYERLDTSLSPTAFLKSQIDWTIILEDLPVQECPTQHRLKQWIDIHPEFGSVITLLRLKVYRPSSTKDPDLKELVAVDEVVEKTIQLLENCTGTEITKFLCDLMSLRYSGWRVHSWYYSQDPKTLRFPRNFPPASEQLADFHSRLYAEYKAALTKEQVMQVEAALESDRLRKQQTALDGAEPIWPVNKLGEAAKIEFEKFLKKFGTTTTIDPEKPDASVIRICLQQAKAVLKLTEDEFKLFTAKEVSREIPNGSYG